MKMNIYRYVLSNELYLRDFCKLRYSRIKTDFLVIGQFSMYFQIFFNFNTLKVLEVREFLIYNWIFLKAYSKMSQSNRRNDTCTSLKVAFNPEQQAQTFHSHYESPCIIPFSHITGGQMDPVTMLHDNK